jgi:TPR repeat protein
VKEDKEMAVYWYKRASELGQLDAILNYGACLLIGDGIEKSVCCF